MRCVTHGFILLFAVRSYSILCCLYAVSSRNQQRIFTRQWFCKFLSVLSGPNNQEQQTSVIEVLRSRGTARAPAVFCNILCHKRTTGNFLLPVFEVTTWQPDDVSCKRRGGGGNASQLAGLGQMIRAAKELQASAARPRAGWKHETLWCGCGEDSRNANV